MECPSGRKLACLFVGNFLCIKGGNDNSAMGSRLEEVHKFQFKVNINMPHAHACLLIIGKTKIGKMVSKG